MDPRRDQRRPNLKPSAGEETPALSVVVPVFNEGENVTPTLRGIVQNTKTRPLEVLVVYDFDEDSTVPVVKKLQEELPQLRLHKNTLGRGVLNAMKSGLRGARAQYVLITMGDGSDNPADIDPMYALARAGADVVAGSRYMSGGRQLGGPLLKRTMSRAAGLSLHWLGGLPTHDATSNFRLYSKTLLNQITIESQGGFELGLELTVKAYRLGMRVAEVPTTWRDRTAGQSRFKLWQWLPRYMHWYWRGMAGRFKTGRG
jgi:glycosyltransferase involved in cell wall biosynthesis